MPKGTKQKPKIWTYAMEQMSYPDVQAILKTTDVVLIPIGSQEKHGPHVPLATDSWATIETTKRAAEKAKVPYTPLIPVGYSPHQKYCPRPPAGTRGKRPSACFGSRPITKWKSSPRTRTVS